MNCTAENAYPQVKLGFSHKRDFKCPQFKTYVSARRLIEEDPAAKESPNHDGAFALIPLTPAVQNTPPLDYYQSIKHLIPDNFYAVFTGTVNGQKKVLVAKAGRILAFDPPPNPFAKN